MLKNPYEQLYTHSQPVRVTLESGEIFEDEIKGLNKGHALHMASLNWKGASIEAIQE